MEYDINNYSTWLEIDLNAIRDNTARIRQFTGREVMAVIKANAYGHGLIPAAQAANAGGATWCGTARVEEALALRRAGISSRLLVLGYTPPAKVPEAIAQNITLALVDEKLSEEYLQAAARIGGRLHAHIKVETGMGRLGMRIERIPAFLKRMQDSDLLIDGIFTHFAQGDEVGCAYTYDQIQRFNQLLADLEAQGIKPPLVHAANSGAIFNYPESWYDLTRPGDVLYGMAPGPHTPLPAGYQPALSWKARLIMVHDFEPGHGISYGARYITKGKERIGVIPIGYGDGFRRVDGQQVLVGGRRVDVVGRVCMDQCMLQLDAVPNAKPGDEVVLIGRQGTEEISVDEVAARWNTINYEVTTGLAERLPRVYLND
jgi:alanine racemase